jgi:hypothetical protein
VIAVIFQLFTSSAILDVSKQDDVASSIAGISRVVLPYESAHLGLKCTLFGYGCEQDWLVVVMVCWLFTGLLGCMVFGMLRVSRFQREFIKANDEQ